MPIVVGVVLIFILRLTVAQLNLDEQKKPLGA
jgi:hypothetical protein